MMTKRTTVRAALCAAAAGVLTLLPACSMMTEDRADCPTCYNPLHVTLKYDYNMLRADLFNDHVQAVTTYVVDGSNRIVAKERVANSATAQPLRNRSFALNFEGLAEGDYRLYAIGGSPAVATQQPGIVPAELAVGDDITTLTIATPHADQPNSEGRYEVRAAQLDTVWHAMNSVPVHVAPYEASFDTLSLVRDTKNVSIVLHQTTEPLENRHSLYDVRIDDATARLGHDNALAESLPLTFRPYAAWTTETLDGSSQVVERVAHYDLSLGRLLAHDDASRNARLLISHRDDGRRIVDIDLAYYLSLARSATALVYSPQEFLDREFDYHLDFFLEGNQWRYVTLSINVLSWSIRIQNETL